MQYHRQLSSTPAGGLVCSRCCLCDVWLFFHLQVLSMFKNGNTINTVFLSKVGAHKAQRHSEGGLIGVPCAWHIANSVVSPSPLPPCTGCIFWGKTGCSRLN